MFLCFKEKCIKDIYFFWNLGLKEFVNGVKIIVGVNKIVRYVVLIINKMSFNRVNMREIMCIGCEGWFKFWWVGKDFIFVVFWWVKVVLFIIMVIICGIICECVYVRLVVVISFCKEWCRKVFEYLCDWFC